MRYRRLIVLSSFCLLAASFLGYWFATQDEDCLLTPLTPKLACITPKYPCSVESDYVENDTPPETIYAYLTLKIIECIESGEEFPQGLYEYADCEDFREY